MSFNEPSNSVAESEVLKLTTALLNQSDACISKGSVCHNEEQAMGPLAMVSSSFTA